MRGAFLTTAKLTLLAFAFTNILYILAQSPVVNTGIRVADHRGEWRMQGVGLLYEQSAYFRVRALDFLFAAADQPTTQESLEVVREAREAAYRGVRTAPADASAWLMVSWTEMVLGNGEEAVLALQRSWSLAPNSLALAYDRLLLTDALGLAVVDDVAPSVRAAVRRDATNLRNADTRSFNAVKEAAPEVVSLVDDEEQPA